MVGVVVAGVEGVRYRGETVYAPAGNLMMVNPGEVHTGFPAAQSPWIYRGLYPSVAAVEEISRDCGLGNRRPMFLGATGADPELATLILSMHIAIESGASALERESTMILTLSAMLRRHAVPGPDRPSPGSDHRAVARVREMLHDNFASDNSLQDLAQQAGISRYHLIRLFRTRTGMSPHQLQTLLRVQHARRLLIGGASPGQAAIEVGFCDQSHLNRHFKSVFGVTPGDYRAATRRPSHATRPPETSERIGTRGAGGTAIRVNLCTSD